MDKHPLLNPGNMIRQPQSSQNDFEIQYCEESYNQVSKNCHNHDLICLAQLSSQFIISIVKMKRRRDNSWIT